MIEAILVVLTKSVPGREGDLDDWYSNIHVRDALRFRGSIAAQRFKRSLDQVQPLPPEFDWQYLALYDVFDAERFSREHWDNALTSRMMVTDAFDDSVLEDYHYYPLQFRDNDPDTRHTGGIILEQLNPAAGREAEFREWYNDDYLPRAVRRQGVHSAAFLVFRRYGQMLPTMPAQNYVGIYRVEGPSAVAEWRNASDLTASPLIDPRTRRVTHWEPIGTKLTKDAVQNPTAAGLAAEEAARARMGDRILTGGKEKLGKAEPPVGPK
jgi:hypothetical protein